MNWATTMTTHLTTMNALKRRRPLGAGLLLGLALTLTATLTPAADLIIDNGTAQFSVVGDWPLSTSIAGYQGSNYQTHIAHGPVPGALTVDNQDAGFSVTGDWPLSTSIAGYLGSHYRTHEANGPKPGSRVIDNGSGVATGTWALSTSVAGYQGTHYQTHAAGTGENSFLWPLSGSGQYRVYAKWTANPNRATNAPYTLRTSAGETTVTVNQQQNGGSWQLLGTYTLDASSQITLTDAANGYVIADAVMAEPVGATANTATWPLPVSVAKNYRVYARWSAFPNRATNAKYTISHSTGQAQVSVNQQQNGGTWQLLGTYALTAASQVSLTDEADGYVIADAVMAVPEEAPTTNSATWTPLLTEAGSYDVYAQWSAYPNRASNAPYAVRHQSGTTTVTVNQQQNGGSWQLLGRFDLVPGQSTITLTDDADGYVIADAIKLTLVSPTTAKLYYFHTDHLDTPKLVTDETNKIVWRNNPLTEPFGMSVPEEDPDADGKAFSMNLRFPGQYADKETNTNYNYFRDYNPELGRYIESDPIGLQGGINTFAYVGGQPLRYVDPSGEILINPITIGAAIGGVAGAIQAANSSGGWSWANSGNIAIGALTGAVAGAIPGGIAARAGLGAAIAVGGAAGAAGNLANQWAGGTSLGCTNWGQAGVQGAIGLLSGGLGYGAGLSSALGVVRSGGSVQGAVAFGNIYGAVTGGAVQVYANLPISTNLGGFVPSSSQNQCGCNN